jgi:hypothetical protein
MSHAGINDATGGGGGNVQTLTGNSGGPVPPSGNNINIVGSGGVLVSGDPGTSTLTITAPGGSGITTIDGNTGSVTGSTVTISVPNTEGTPTFNGSGTTLSLDFTDSNLATCIGTNAGNIGTNSGRITAVGYNALNGQTSANYNTAVGAYSMGNSTAPGVQNTALGDSSGYELNAGTDNTCIGYAAGGSITSGSFNVFLGSRAGENLDTTESNNVIINTQATVSDNNTLRIGAATGNGTRQLNKAFISGIYGITTTSGTTSAVLVSNGDQLGTVSSSKRFKDNIVDMGEDSSPLMKLRPVRFTYKSQKCGFKHFGLIAEEVYKVMPELVNLDEEGIPREVRYHDMPSILLNEIQKLNNRILELEKRVRKG